MLVIRSFQINVYEVLMMSTSSAADTGTGHSPGTEECASLPPGAPQCSLPPPVPWLRVFEHSVFWFLPPACSRLLVTVALAMTHLVHVCVSQVLGMLGGAGRSGDQVCMMGSFFWRVAEQGGEWS